MRIQNANSSQEDKLIKTYLQRRVIITSVTQDSDGMCWGAVELFLKLIR